MSLFYIKKTKFKEYYNKFKREENEKNYNKLVCFIGEKLREINCDFKVKFGALLTSKNGVVIYNSRKINTFE